MRPVLFLLLSVFSASGGQILFKKGVLATGEITLRSSMVGDLVRLLIQPAVFSGLVLYIISTILWLIALSKTTLNFAYPFTALTFALVMISSKVIFNEHIPMLRYFGIIMICFGILLSAMADG